MESLICIDSNAMSYLVDAMTQGCKPTGNVADEKIALLRTYLYRNDILYISPTVKEEYEKIKSDVNRRNHQGIADILLGDIPASVPTIIESRILEYSKHHSGEKNKKDCKILAEAELGGSQILLTYDKIFLINLRGKTRGIKMSTPSEYWNNIGIPKGSRPVRAPYSTNPLSRETWWIW